MVKEITVFSAPSCAELQDSLVNSKVEGVKFIPGTINWNKFPDGTPNISIDNIEELVWNKHVIFIADFLPQEFIFPQYSVIYVLARNYALSVSVVLPFYPTGTMERVDNEGAVYLHLTFTRYLNFYILATADCMSHMINCLPCGRDGPNRWFIYDIHALPERFFFRDNAITVLRSGVPLFNQVLQKMDNSKGEIAIGFPDEGACKRFGKKFPGYELIICAKVRQGDKRVVNIVEGNGKDKHVIIIDDLVQSGGTLIECKDALFKQGAKEVSCYVTHAVFPNDSWQKFLPEAKCETKPFSTFFLTDSIPATASKLKGKKPFEVISIGPDVAQNVTSFLQ